LGRLTELNTSTRKSMLKMRWIEQRRSGDGFGGRKDEGLMEILFKAARDYQAGMISRFEFRTRVAEAVNAAFHVEDVERLVALLLQNSMAE
jgi:hypothetical protein